MANNIDGLILRSWGNISGILGPWFIEVIKKNRITLRKTLRGPASSQLYISGGGSPEFFLLLKSQVRHLATFVPSLGRVGQGA